MLGPDDLKIFIIFVIVPTCFYDIIRLMLNLKNVARAQAEISIVKEPPPPFQKWLGQPCRYRTLLISKRAALAKLPV